MSEPSLAGRRVVVLGGSAGIGLSIARASAAAGADVTIVSSSSERVHAALATLPAGSEGHAVDLRDEAAIVNLFERVGTLDHLVYTAGDSLATAPFASIDLAQARAFLEVRFWGALAAVKAAAPRIRPGGSVVLTGGIAADRPGPGWTVVSGVCAAMEAVTRGLALELAPTRVNLVKPGFVRTELWRTIPEPQREALFASAAASLPVKRIGEPDEIARTYLFLMTQGFATGQSFVVDGGGTLV